MISVVRTLSPTSLSKNAAKWTQDLDVAINRYKTNSTKKNKKLRQTAFNKYRHNEIRKELIRIFNDKCAYCESHISHISYSNIEHYRPKARFPKKTFLWDNLLLSCEICNSPEYKGQKFPSGLQNGPYINPCVDNPNSHFKFEYDIKTKTALVLGKTARGKKTEIDLGLNRHILLRHRSPIVRNILYVGVRLQKNNFDAEARAILIEATQPQSEYSAFTKAIIKKLKLKIP